MNDIVELKPIEPGHLRNRRGQSATDVIDAIECITTIPTESIAVTVRDDWVELEGTLKERHQKDAVEDLVRHLAGVRGVTNSITIESGVSTN